MALALPQPRWRQLESLTHVSFVMALLENLDFTGPLGNMTAYKMRGCDKTVLRTKGGAKKEQIKTSPRFAVPRLYMSEFAGCSTMGKELRRMLVPVRGLADYNISGTINKLLKAVQKQDTTSALGRRSILLSKHSRMLEGFSFNKKNPFDSLVRNTLTFAFDRSTHAARVDIPALIRDINFFPNNNHPMFSLTVALGVVPDFIFNEATRLYEAPAWYNASFGAKEVSTPWHFAKEGLPATTLDIALDKIPPGEAYSLVLSIGIRFGTVYGGGVIEPVKYAGAAKVLALRGGNTPATSAPDDNDDEAVTEVTPAVWEEMKEDLPQGIVVKDSAESVDPLYGQVMAANGLAEEKTKTNPSYNTTDGLSYVYTFQSGGNHIIEPVPEVYAYAIALDQPQQNANADVSNISSSVEVVNIATLNRIKDIWEYAQSYNYPVAFILQGLKAELGHEALTLVLTPAFTMQPPALI